MSSESDPQIENTEREVIRLLFELLSKWDHVLEYTDQILQSIAEKYKNSISIQSTLQQIKRLSNNRTANESTQTESSAQNHSKTSNTEKEKPKVEKTRAGSKNKKTTPEPKTKTKKKSFANELEENFTKLDDIIDYYADLKDRAVRTIISHGKASKAAKEVNQEMNDIIEEFDKISINK